MITPNASRFAISVLVSWFAFVLTSCGWPPPGVGPEPKTTETFTSARLGRDYELRIFPVEGPGPHPLVLVLDGMWNASAVERTLNDMSEPGFRKPLVVGINTADLGTATPGGSNTSRDKDYTPVPCTSEYEGAKPEDCGGAREFFEAVELEVLPHLTAMYGASGSRADRGLAGHSYSGLATVYAAFHFNHVFSKYVAGSPSLWFADGVALTWPGKWAQTHDDFDAALWTGVGSWELGTTQTTQVFERRVRSQAWPSLRFRHENIPAKGHVGVAFDTLDHGLRFTWGSP